MCQIHQITWTAKERTWTARDDPDALSVVYCELQAPVGPRASISSMIAIDYHLIMIIVTLVTHDAKLSQKNRLPKGATWCNTTSHGMLWSASDTRMEPERLADFGSDDKARQPGLVIYENDACKSRRLRITPWLQAISARPWCGDCCISSLTILISMPSISEIDRSQSEKMNQLLFMNKCYHDYHIPPL